MFSVSIRTRSILLASAATVATVSFARAQTAPQTLPPVVVEADKQDRPVRNRRAEPSNAPLASTAPATSAAAPQKPLGNETADQARTEIQQTPGGVAVVAAEDYKTSSVANTIKDILGYVPGVFAQPKWGDDTQPFDSRIEPVAEFPSPRRPALHGRHSD